MHEPPSAASSIADEGRARGVSLPVMATILVVAAVLHLGSEVFLPLAIATLITFALSPIVAALRRRGIGQIVSVLAVVTLAFTVIGAFMLVTVSQLTSLAASLPEYQSNIIIKLEALQQAGHGTGVISRLSDMLGQINAHIAAMPGGETGAAPVAVEVVENQSPWRLMVALVLPLVSPVATVGLIIVVVIFMLLERAELRDRLLRLIGSNDLHRTTGMLEDAGSRVATYLLIQLLVNVIYALPIGLGLWLIGVPNAPLWALLTLVLRFLPYIGTVLAAGLPLLLSFAASPDWSMVLWTAALFGAVELITSNLVEPWLYGSRTGLSPLAVIVAAILWTWIWGPMGLILSTPLTVCLVVLGRHLPPFEIFDILFGDEAVLPAHARLYQRLLAGDLADSTARAEEELEQDYLADYYRDVGLPALLLAQADRARGVLDQVQEARLVATATEFVTALEPVADDELAALLLAEAAEGRTPEQRERPPIWVTGGRGPLDEVAAAMVGQAFRAEGAGVTVLSRNALRQDRGALLPADAQGCLLIGYLDPDPLRSSLLAVRRAKRAAPGLRVGVVLFQMPELQDAPAVLGESGPPAAIRAAEEIGADFVTTSLIEAMEKAVVAGPARPLPELMGKPARSRAWGR